MKTQICPSCKSKLPGKAKNCPSCGLALPTSTNAGLSRKKSISIAAAAIIIIIVAAAAMYAINLYSGPDNPLSEHNTPEEVQEKNTLKDLLSREKLTPDDIMTRFNTFVQNANADSLSIEELVLESGTTEDIYHDIKNNEDISISITARKEDKAATSILVLAGSDDNPTTFITYCLALRSIFTPTMDPDIRQKNFYRLVGYDESENKFLVDKKTYVTGETKFIFTNSGQEGLSMWIEQMPECEVVEGALPII